MKSLTLRSLQLAASLLLAFGALATTAAEDAKVNPTGTWTWTITTQNGQEMKTTLKLKLDGDKLSGTVSGRQSDTAIEEAKLKGDTLTFKVTRERNGMKITQNYSGKVAADTIKGKIEFERNGEQQSREWNAKKETEKKE